MGRLICMAGGLLALAGAAWGQSRPNLLIVVADDLGVANVGVLNPAGIGGTPPPTPRIDALAASGVTFTRAWSAPVCSPTRAALLTGRFGFRTGVRAVGDTLPRSEDTLAEVLATAGYRNALIGKWHLGTTNRLGGDDAPRVAGWDRYAGGLGGGVGDYFAWNKSIDGSPPAQTNRYATSDAVDEALAWIGGQTDPWSCIVAFNAPHAPFHEPNDALHSYDLSSGGDTLRYKAMVEALDTEIGRLLDGLGPAVLANTLVVFVGDNGTPAGVTEAPIVHAKGSVYEGGVRVPLVISGPGVAGPGRTHDGLVHVADLFVTLAEQAGVDPAAAVAGTLDGVSLSAVLADPNAAGARTLNYTEVVGGDVSAGLYAVCSQRYKLVYNGVGYELYDLETDPFELNDRVAAGLTAAEQLAYDGLLSYLDGLRSGLCSVDIDGDLTIGLSDLSALLAVYGSETGGAADVDGSGRVDLSDLATLLNEFGQSCW